jgi:hypothetical protein
MFDTAYPFHLIDHRDLPVGGSQLAIWKYNFRSYRRRYIIEIELYAGPVYVIKYYANCHASSAQKFNLLLKDEKPAPIIRTCINVMLAVYQRDPLASFGFIGSHSVNKENKGQTIEEQKTNTQRFRIYQTLMFNFFGTGTFEHAQSVKHSAYLLINRNHHPVDQFKLQAETMFANLYIAFEA